LQRKNRVEKPYQIALGFARVMQKQKLNSAEDSRKKRYS
jgi:hypothetical protein